MQYEKNQDLKKPVIDWTTSLVIAIVAILAVMMVSLFFSARKPVRYTWEEEGKPHCVVVDATERSVTICDKYKGDINSLQRFNEDPRKAHPWIAK